MSATHASVGTAPSLSAMAKIETKRLARNPFFILSVLVTFGLTSNFVFNSKHDTPGDLLSWPVVPAFFIGLTSLVLMARQTRSTEEAAEALTAAPGTEARRTQALLVACLLPGGIGFVYAVYELIAMKFIKDPSPQEWWFGTMNDAQVLAMLFGTTAVACLGGALLGVLSGRWVHFRGASAVVVVALVVVTMIGQAPGDGSMPTLKLFVPWVSWQSGTQDDGTATLYAGNAIFQLVYILCLCAAAALVAIRHDRAARAPQLKRAIVTVTVLGLVGLGLAMTTGASDNKVSDPVPWHVKK